MTRSKRDGGALKKGVLERSRRLGNIRGIEGSGVQMAKHTDENMQTVSYSLTLDGYLVVI